MAKELPYFRFTPQEWQNGDISLERFELRGLFIDICCYYWINNCSIAREKLEKRYINDLGLLNELICLDILQWDEKSDFIQINFLNEQFDVLSEQRKRRQKAGSKGGKQKSSNAKAELKQNSSYKDKDKDNYKEKDNINIDNDFIQLETEFKNEQWKETLCMNYSISLKDMDNYIKEFLIDRQSDESYKEQSIHELKNWFVNFIKKKKETPSQEINTQSLAEKVLKYSKK